MQYTTKSKGNPMIDAILFDRDGTLIADKHYLFNPNEVKLLPGVGEALGYFTQKGIRLFMISNQSGIGRGYFSQEAVDACNDQVQKLLQPFEARLEVMLYCPHAPNDTCTCRKPATGMWVMLSDGKHMSYSIATDAQPLSASRVIMVGDKPEDMLFAANAGLAGSVLVLTGKGQQTAQSAPIARFFKGKNSNSGATFYECRGEKYPYAVIQSFFDLDRAVMLIDSLIESK